MTLDEITRDEFMATVEEAIRQAIANPGEPFEAFVERVKGGEVVEELTVVACVKKPGAPIPQVAG